jgi:16S rRNA (guanine527-N7)-methyltransferase
MVESRNMILWKYFDPDSVRKSQFEQLGPLYRELNQNINVISRKDIDFLYLHHVLHSLALVRFDKFEPDHRILDLGTGGGFPGIPLAIWYPECHFTLIDGTQKKIHVVNTLIRELGLTNVEAYAVRAEEFKGTFDYVVSRAVASTQKIWQWSKHLVRPKPKKVIYDPRILLLKGGDLTDELRTCPFYYKLFPIERYFEEAYFNEKYILAF